MEQSDARDDIAVGGDVVSAQGEKERAKQFWSMSLFLYPEQPEIKAKHDKL